MFHPKQEIFDTLQNQVVITCEKPQLNINDGTNNSPPLFAVPFLSLPRALQNGFFAFPSPDRPEYGLPHLCVEVVGHPSFDVPAPPGGEGPEAEDPALTHHQHAPAGFPDARGPARALLLSWP